MLIVGLFNSLLHDWRKWKLGHRKDSKGRTLTEVLKKNQCQWHNRYTMKAQSLERTIVKAIARVKPDDWLPCSIGDLRLRMRDIEAEALNASMNSIIETCIFLLENGYILVGKKEGGGKRLPFDL